jgi:organic hydroperoxide reductase OsmC/OhrA
MPQHRYEVAVNWTGNTGSGTSGYRAYSRDHEVRAPGLPTIVGSSDPAFRGDPHRWNPEMMLVAALSQCHMLWFLHLAATAGVVVTDYLDNAEGTMVETASGAGQFTEVVLHPQVTVAEVSTVALLAGIHESAHEHCFLARSVNFPVRHTPVAVVRHSA